MLVVDDDAVTRRILETTLAAAGMSVIVTSGSTDALRIVGEQAVALVLLDLVMPAPDGFDVLRVLRREQKTRDVPVVVLTALEGGEDITRAFEAGADDFLRKPFRGEELLARIRGQLRLRDYVDELATKEHDAQALLELSQALASSLDFREILYTVVRRIADVVKVERASIVLVREDGQSGIVVAASDDHSVSNLTLDLSKYPEIQRVVRTRKPLTIEDVATHPVLDGVRADVSGLVRSSLTVFPIVYEERAMGVLFLRAAESRGALTEREIGFCATVANATAVALRNARILQSLRDQTQQITFARAEAERRLETLRPYADFFAAAADGMAVLDSEGRLLFANPRAHEIIGWSSDQIGVHELLDIVSPADRLAALRIVRGFGRGRYPKNVDLHAVGAGGDKRTLNVSFSPLPGGDGAAICSFRDVTAERETATELAKTKSFLEKLIDSSVDAIVAADLKGRIIVFNKGAERIYDRRADDVIGQLDVEALYPPGVAREVMKRIRSEQHGGRGRLEALRTEAVDSHGVRIPIMLSASLIYEGGRPVASVGIFTDLRERVRMEERLAEAQHQLALSEKHAIVAELAGTAAHELNQPLTSIMGYAELLKRRLERNASQYQAADIIVREAERMAEIVRKIGKITKYETKSYVGRTQILDLDRSCA
ncbi:MAG: PAS domain S-box protein, partial [Deltaproteobacteria bacterium]|nr:PAS domain S-box protein [Deltaproteobacteria bacterium]